VDARPLPEATTNAYVVWALQRVDEKDLGPEIAAELHRLPFTPFARVRRQFIQILGAVNRGRKEAGVEAMPVTELRLRRRIVRPFDHAVREGEREAA
jgi:hypothetical protein